MHLLLVYQYVQASDHKHAINTKKKNNRSSKVTCDFTLMDQPNSQFNESLTHVCTRKTLQYLKKRNSLCSIYNKLHTQAIKVVCYQ